MQAPKTTLNTARLSRVWGRKPMPMLARQVDMTRREAVRGVSLSQIQPQKYLPRAANRAAVQASSMAG